MSLEGDANWKCRTSSSVQNIELWSPSFGNWIQKESGNEIRKLYSWISKYIVVDNTWGLFSKRRNLPNWHRQWGFCADNTDLCIWCSASELSLVVLMMGLFFAESEKCADFRCSAKYDHETCLETLSPPGRWLVFSFHCSSWNVSFALRSLGILSIVWRSFQFEGGWRCPSNCCLSAKIVFLLVFESRKGTVVSVNVLWKPVKWQTGDVTGGYLKGSSIQSFRVNGNCALFRNNTEFTDRSEGQDVESLLSTNGLLFCFQRSFELCEVYWVEHQANHKGKHRQSWAASVTFLNTRKIHK